MFYFSSLSSQENKKLWLLTLLVSIGSYCSYMFCDDIPILALHIYIVALAALFVWFFVKQHFNSDYLYTLIALALLGHHTLYNPSTFYIPTIGILTMLFIRETLKHTFFASIFYKSNVGKTISEETIQKIAQSSEWLSRIRTTFRFLHYGISAGLIGLLLTYFYVPALAFSWSCKAILMLLFFNPHTLYHSAFLYTLFIFKRCQENHIHINNQKEFENISSSSLFLFNITGIFTKNTPSLQEIISCKEYAADLLACYGAALAQAMPSSNTTNLHQYVEIHGLQIPEATSVKIHPGKGVQGVLHDELFYYGSLRFMEELSHNEETKKHFKEIKKQAKKRALEGYDILFIAKNNSIEGMFVFQDPLHSNAPLTCSKFEKKGISYSLLTHLPKHTAQAHAAQLGAKEYVYDVLPKKESAKIKEFQKKGSHVTFIGNRNNQGAFQVANRTIYVGEESLKTDIAIASANPLLIYTTLQLSSKLHRMICLLSTLFILMLGGALALAFHPSFLWMPMLTFSLCAQNTLILSIGFSPLRKRNQPFQTSSMARILLPAIQNKEINFKKNEKF